MKQRNYSGYLIIDYKTGKVRAVRKMKKIMPFEIAVRYSLNLNVPELADTPIIKGDINIPKVDIDGTSFKV